MKNMAGLATFSIIATALTLGGIAFSPERGIAITPTAGEHNHVSVTPTDDDGGTVVLPPGGPVSLYPRDQSVGGANPFVPYGPNPMVPYGVWTGLEY